MRDCGVDSAEERLQTVQKADDDDESSNDVYDERETLVCIEHEDDACWMMLAGEGLPRTRSWRAVSSFLQREAFAD